MLSFNARDNLHLSNGTARANDMNATDFSIRSGRREDAAVLAELVNYAGEGLPLYLWEKMAGAGGDAWS
jgi:hypothetical protein